MPTVPSYLFRRGTIYYFQARIPVGLAGANDYNPRKMIRRSTRTGNRREALRIARKWWVQLMTNDSQFEDHMDIDAIERQIDVEENMYFKGKKLAEKMSKINPNISFEFNRFTDELSDYEVKCLEFYETYQQKVASSPSTHSDHPPHNKHLST